jgi:hypothetical protein
LVCISNLLTSRRLKFGKIEVSGAQDQKSTEIAAVRTKFNELKKSVEGIFSKQSLSNMDHVVENDLEYSKIPEGDRNQALKDYSKFLGLIYHAENTYNDILGSQLILLDGMNSGDTYTDEGFENYYKEFTKIHPDIYRDYGVKEYVNWMLGRQLIHKADNEFSITQYGIDFLKYVITTGRKLYKNN